MRLAALLLPVTLVGCTLAPGSMDVLSPERDGAATAVPDAAVPDAAEPDAAEPDAGFALDGYKDEQAEADAASMATDGDAVAAQLGAEGVEVPDDLPVDAMIEDPSADDTDDAEVVEVAEVAEVAEAPITVASDPPPATVPQPVALPLSWGVRLVSTVHGGTPPRAILGLPDGSERVVKAGDLLPDAGVVVLAVGRDMVQLGQVTPHGDHARVESVFLRAMFPTEGGRP